MSYQLGKKINKINTVKRKMEQMNYRQIKRDGSNHTKADRHHVKYSTHSNRSLKTKREVSCK